MKFLYILISFAAICFVSCNKEETKPTVDTSLRGIFGSIELYNEFGEKQIDFSGVSITAYCTDTLQKDSLGNALLIFDTTLNTTSDIHGRWLFKDNPRGFYNIHIKKDTYGEFVIHKHWYDTVRADSIRPLFLAQTPPAKVTLDSLRISDGLMYISRTISFTKQYNTDYATVSWYFFDSTKHVSPVQHVYAYRAGASYGNLNKNHSFTIIASIENLRAAGFSEHDSVYVMIGLDNFKYQRYSHAAHTYIYPNIKEVSNVLSFHID